MTDTRQRLPNRRAHEVIGFTFRGREYLAGVAHYPDGRPAELFIDPIKGGADATADARDAAVAASLAFQHGVSIQCLRDALTRDQNGMAAGVLGAALDAMTGEPQQ